MSQASNRENRLLIIAGRVHGLPQVCFNVEPVGTITSNTDCVDVCGSVAPNGFKRMMRLKLVSQATLEAVSFADVKRSVAVIPEEPAKDVDSRDGEITDRTNRI